MNTNQNYNNGNIAADEERKAVVSNSVSGNSPTSEQSRVQNGDDASSPLAGGVQKNRPAKANSKFLGYRFIYQGYRLPKIEYLWEVNDRD